MPELPEVEITRRELIKILVGRPIIHAKTSHLRLRLNYPLDLLEIVIGQSVTHIERRAKYLLLFLTNNKVLINHLGMSGKFYQTTAQVPFHSHDHFIFFLQDGYQVRYYDPRRFGVMTLTDATRLSEHPLLKELGAEPFSISPLAFQNKLQQKKAPIKNVLLDQRVIAGLGNIYVCESLYLAKISPFTPASSLSPAQSRFLLGHIQRLLLKAIQKGGSTLQDYAEPSGAKGRFQNYFAVYGKEGQPCPHCTCQEYIQRVRQAGRSTFYCPH